MLSPRIDLAGGPDLPKSARAGPKEIVLVASRAGLRPADWLNLAAAPTFAVMALLAGISGGPADVLCAAAQPASLLSGMVAMYVLMTIFHAGPWLRLIATRCLSSPRRRRVGGRTGDS